MASGASNATIINPTRFPLLIYQGSYGSFGTFGCNATQVHKNIVDAQLRTILGSVRQCRTSSQTVVLSKELAMPMTRSDNISIRVEKNA